MSQEQGDSFSVDFSNFFDPRTAGLLVIDVQEKLWPFISSREQALKRMVQAIHVAGEMGLPILVTEQYVKGLGATIAPITEALDKYDAYHPIEKFAFSCFGEPNFEEAFDATEIETLAVIGIEAHVCVLQTSLDAIDRGLDVFYIAEATGSRDLDHKAEAVHRVRDTGAIVGSVEMFAFEAMRTAKHPAFRKVQKIIV
ncbi:MAG: isochorismatase family protein [Myxococcota bacterium]|nr:isochorismatase family protein [Myxococcota bacterium]